MSTSKLPESIESTIFTNTTWGCYSLGDKWIHSQKRPDLAIEVKNADGDLEFKWILEVGFSETYGDLVEDMKQWLEGTESVSMVVLLNSQRLQHTNVQSLWMMTWNS